MTATIRVLDASYCKSLLMGTFQIRRPWSLVSLLGSGLTTYQDSSQSTLLVSRNFIPLMYYVVYKKYIDVSDLSWWEFN